jgi:twitching motility two-component system response regulator PilH
MNILIVDDVQTDRDLLGQVVSGAGHEPVYASDGDQALAAVKQFRPALVFMDVVMPRMNGFSACRVLKKDPDTASIPVVLVTSKGTDSDRFWGRKQGADDHVAKPFTPEMLMPIIRKYVG